jgi:hypothetical protein
MLLVGTLVCAVVRPRGWPEAVFAVPAAAVLLLAGALSLGQAEAEARSLAPTIGFLAAVLVLACGPAVAHALRDRRSHQRGPLPRRSGSEPEHSPSQGRAQGRGGRRHRVANRDRSAPAAPLAGQEGRASVPDRAPGPGRPARDGPRSGQGPGPPLVPPSRRGLRGSDGGLDPASAPALGSHPRRRGRSQHLHAARPTPATPR